MRKFFCYSVPTGRPAASTACCLSRPSRRYAAATCQHILRAYPRGRAAPDRSSGSLLAAVTLHAPLQLRRRSAAARRDPGWIRSRSSLRATRTRLPPASSGKISARGRCCSQGAPAGRARRPAGRSSGCALWSRRRGCCGSTTPPETLPRHFGDTPERLQRHFRDTSDTVEGSGAQPPPRSPALPGAGP